VLKLSCGCGLNADGEMADRISILEVEYKRQCDENVRLVSELEDVNRLRTESLQQIKSKLNATEETLRDTEQVSH